jgi:hypothetical protein
VDSYVGKPAGGIESFEQWRDLGHADGERNIDIRRDGYGRFGAGAKSDGDFVDCGPPGGKRTRDIGNRDFIAGFGPGGQRV